MLQNPGIVLPRICSQAFLPQNPCWNRLLKNYTWQLQCVYQIKETNYYKIWELLILDWRLNISTSQIQYQKKSKMWKNCQLIHLICQLAILKENIDLRSQREKWMAFFLSIALTSCMLCPWERLDFQKAQDCNKIHFIHLMKAMEMHFKQEIFMVLIRGLNVANTVAPILLLLIATNYPNY